MGDCVKRYLVGVGVEWRMRTRNRGSEDDWWRQQ